MMSLNTTTLDTVILSISERGEGQQRSSEVVRETSIQELSVQPGALSTDGKRIQEWGISVFSVSF